MKIFVRLLVALWMLANAGCAGMNASQQRMLSGGAIGAGAGALVAGPIGLVAGGVIGAATGHEAPRIKGTVRNALP